MIVLRRGVGEKLVLGDVATLKVVSVKDGVVRIEIASPPGVPVHRAETRPPANEVRSAENPAAGSGALSCQAPSGGGGELVLKIDVPDDATDEEVVTAVTELVSRLDDLHRAYGGGGLQIDSLEATGEVPVPEGVCQ